MAFDSLTNFQLNRLLENLEEWMMTNHEKTEVRAEFS